MKLNIHPNWFSEAKVVCACGNTFTTGSTQESIRVEICYKCHPFFTGQQKFVDTLGQVERFQKKTQTSEAKRAEKIQIKQNREAKVKVDRSDKPSLRDLLMQARKNIHSWQNQLHFPSFWRSPESLPNSILDASTLRS